MTDLPCPFCKVPPDDVIAQSDLCVVVWTGEPPEGSAMVIPRAHRQSLWDLTPTEWAQTQQLLTLMKRRLETSHDPDGWNVGWNVGQVGGQSVDHAHCHLVPRYRDERYAGKGLRWLFKQPENHVPIPPA